MKTLLLALAFLLTGLWFSTYLVAQALENLHYPLAPSLMIGVPLFPPWQYLIWLFSLSQKYPAAFAGQSILFYVACLSSMLVLVAKKIKTNSHLNAHGSAHWAGPAHMREAKLLEKEGVVLGLTSDEKQYLRHNGPEHIFVFAPTRSGKGVGIVVPTLLSWSESVLCFDPKGENWQISSGFRDTLGKVIYFNPCDKDSHRFNPLREVRMPDFEVKDAQNIADMLVDPEGSKQIRSHWEKAAHSLLVGAILHVLYSEEDKTLSGVYYFLSSPQRTIAEMLELMLNTKHLGDCPHQAIASIAREMLNKAPEELSGVISTATSLLTIFQDPIVANASCESDFSIEELFSSEKPLSVYLVVPPSDLSRMRGLIRLILNQIIRKLTEQPSAKRRRLLLLIDEMPALGKLDFLESSLAYMAGYGIKALLITQSLNQLESAYGHSNSILDNCHVRVAFACNDERTAKRLSETLGQQTLEKEQRSVSHNNKDIWGNSSLSYQQYARALLTPSEIMQLKPDQQIILVANHPPLLGKKLRYYNDGNFTQRLLAAASIEKFESKKKVKDLIETSTLSEKISATHSELAQSFNMQGSAL